MAVNPYTPGAGRRPNTLVGREIQLALVAAAAEQFEGGYEAENVIFHGLRGMGKTVFLKEVAEQLRRRGWLCGYSSVRHGTPVGLAVAQILSAGSPLLPPDSSFARSMRAFSERIGPVTLSPQADGSMLAVDTGAGAGRGSGGRGGAGRAGGGRAVPDRAGAGRGGGGRGGGGRDEGAGARDLFGDLVRVLGRLGEMAQSSKVGVALLVDEMQELRREEMAALVDAVSSVAPLPVFLVGAGLPYLPTELASACTWAERLRFESLGRLTGGAARRAVVEPAARFGVNYSTAAEELLLNEADGYPFFIQLYASEAWRAAGTPSGAPGTVIELDHVATAVPEVKRILADGLYLARYGRASEKERTYLEAMAKLGAHGTGQTVRSGDVAKALGRELSSLSPIRDSLIKKGLIHSPGIGVLEFSVPGFGTYVLFRATEDG